MNHLQTSFKPKFNNRFGQNSGRNWFQWFFKLRYRIYAGILIVLVSLIMFASNNQTGQTVEAIGYEIIARGTLADRIQKLPVETEDERSQSPSTNVAQTPTKQSGITTISKDGKEVFVDEIGGIITQKLRDANWDVSHISGTSTEDLKSLVGITDGDIKEYRANIEKLDALDKAKVLPKTLDDIIPKPQSAALTNLLEYPKYNIKVPLIYTNFEDVFEKNGDGTIDFTKQRDADSIDSPVQRKLEKGILHLAWTPLPGETGNSYIIGHSSNFSSVNSPYNTVFKPIEERSKVGEEFFIWDKAGRRLKFKVFEVLKIEDKQGDVAYKNYPDKRVVTLQTSILGWRGGQIAATHRWLTRGELVIE